MARAKAKATESKAAADTARVAEGAVSAPHVGLRVEEWPIARLRDYERNPRKNDGAIDRMVTAIKEFGFRIPVVAKSDGLVVDGHLRLKAARKLNMETVPVALADDLTDAQIKAFRIAVNKSAEWAEWDDALLKIELDDLKAMQFDVGLTGFDEAELAAIFADKTDGLTDPDDAPEAPDVPVTRTGDVWLLGATVRCPKCGKTTDAGKAASA